MPAVERVAHTEEEEHIEEPLLDEPIDVALASPITYEAAEAAARINNTSTEWWQSWYMYAVYAVAGAVLMLVIYWAFMRYWSSRGKSSK